MEKEQIRIGWVNSHFAWYPIKTIDNGWVWLEKVTKCCFLIPSTYHFENVESEPLKESYKEMRKDFYFSAKENYLIFLPTFTQDNK